MIAKLIKKLISETEKGNYQWKNISECIEDNCNLINVSLRDYVVGTNKSYYNNALPGKKEFWRKLFLGYDYGKADDFIYYPLSYSLEIEGGVITLLTYCKNENERYYKLVAQNTPNGFPGPLNVYNEFQEELFQLLKTIKNQNDNVDTLIKKIIGND